MFEDDVNVVRDSEVEDLDDALSLSALARRCSATCRGGRKDSGTPSGYPMEKRGGGPLSFPLLYS